MKGALTYIVIALALISGFSIGFFIGKPGAGVPGIPEAKPDTLWIHDTLRIIQPKPQPLRIYDTVWLAVHDTTVIHRHDTIYAPAPRRTDYYNGPGYEAWVTGYRASLDSIYIEQKTAIIEVPKYQTVTKRTHWGIGVQAGATYLPGTGFTPYVGIGISYNPLTF